MALNEAVEDILESLKNGREPSPELLSGIAAINAAIACFYRNKGGKFPREASAFKGVTVLPTTNKKHTLTAALEHYPIVSIIVDTRNMDVAVPKHCRSESTRLDIGYSMSVPIPDLEIDDYGVRCTLSFSGSFFKCSIPWNRIYLMFWGTGKADNMAHWPSDDPRVMPAS